MPKYILQRDLFGFKKGTEILPSGEVKTEVTFGTGEKFMDTIRMFTAFEVYLLLKDGVIREEGEKLLGMEVNVDPAMKDGEWTVVSSHYYLCKCMDENCKNPHLRK